MKEFTRFIIILGIILSFQTRLANAQCYVNYVDPSYFEFSYFSDYEYIYIYAYPEDCTCTPGENSSSWLSLTQMNGSVYVIAAEDNTGSARYGGIHVGDAYIEVYQEGAPIVPLEGGSISVGTTTLCYNTSPGIIYNSESASGGNNYYSYQWQSSTDGANYSDISGAINSAYYSGNMPASKYFRRRVESDNSYAYSNAVYINVYPQLNAGLISGNQSICYNTEPNPITNYQWPSGGTGSYTYQWQSSLDSSTWTDIPGATSPTFSPGALQTKYYRRICTSGVCTASTSSVEVTVLTNSVAPTSITVYQYSQCPGTRIDLNVNGGEVGTGASLFWYAGSLTGSPIGSNSELDVYPSSSTQYFVRYEGECNTTDAATTTVNVRASSTAPTSVSFSPSNACPGETVSVSVVGGNLTPGSAWKWYYYNGSIYIPVGQGATWAFTAGSITTYYVRAEGSCNDGTQLVGGTFSIKTVSTTPTSITSSPSSVCPGLPSTVSLQGSLGTNANWVWYAGGPGGTSIGQGNSITVNPSVTTAYYVRAEGGCQPSEYSTGIVTIKTLSAAPTSITVNRSNECPGSTVELIGSGGSVGTGAGMVWYAGSLTGTPIGYNSEIQVSPSSSTQYFVRYEGTCNNSDAATAYVNVRASSTSPTSVSFSPSNVCPGETVSASVVGGNLTPGSAWKWYYYNGTQYIYVGEGATRSITAGSIATYYVRAEGPCNDYTQLVGGTFSIKTASTTPTSITSSPGSVCPGLPSTLSLQGSLGTEADWIWYAGSPGGTSIGQGADIDVNSSVTTTYYVRAEGGCGPSEYATVDRIVSPAIANQPINMSVGQFQDASFSISAQGDNLLYQWESSSNKFDSWTPLTSLPAVNYTTATLTIQAQSPAPETKFYRCKVTSNECLIYSNLVSNPVSLSYLKSPALPVQSHTGKTIVDPGTSLTLSAHSDNGIDWTNTSIWNFVGPGTISWDEAKHAWKVIGEKWMYLAESNAIPIDNNRSYAISVEVFRENNESKSFMWGGKRLATDKSTVLAGIGGTFDYSATSGPVFPQVGQWVKYTIDAKTGTANSYNGWNTDNCAYYAIGGFVNYNGTNNQVTYVRNIEFFETGQEFTYQWKKDGENIPGAVSSNHTIASVTGQDIGAYTCSISGSNGVIVTSPINVYLEGNYIPSEPSSEENYVQIKEPGDATNIEADFLLLTKDKMRESIQYYDGLGRLSQSISVNGSPAYNDIISPVYYDDYGKESVKYLPYTKEENFGAFRLQAITEQGTFYDNENYFPGDIAKAKTVFESSPLNRILEQGAPGRPWQPYDESDSQSGHTVKFDYLSNSQYEVLLWKVSDDNLVNTEGETSNSFNYYTANTLLKTVTKDENWTQTEDPLHTTEEFKDFQGNIVLKRTYVKNGSTTETLNTYYIYDDFNLLRYVLSPKAVSNITGSMDQLLASDDIIKGLCYYYKYDERNRMITKQLPGAEPVYMVYDKRDRLVLTQDGNNRTSNKWLFTKYDVLNRPVLVGILTMSSSENQEEMQALVDSVYSSSSREYSVERNSSLTATLGYTDTSFPISTDGTLEYLSATYYDNYDFPGVTQFDDGSIISSYINQGNTHYFDRTIGLVTGTKELVLETSTYITTTSYYDDRYRVLESLKNLYGDNNGYEIISNSYDFVGNLLQNRQTFSFNGSITRVDRYYTYDHMGRLLKTESEINGSNRLTVSEITYNELAQMTKKGLSKYNSSYLQEVDYTYNIRGWLSKINDPDNLGTDLFSMNLMYENPGTLTNLTKEPQYNGNISGVIWNRKTAPENTTKSAYSFSYDALNRIANNYYGEGSSLTNSEKYREYDYSYDLNSNILTLNRNNSTGAMMDNLAYSYLSSGLSNQLGAVADNSLNTAGFNDRNSSGNDYAYDNNGNLTQDLNKGIATITYNFLNLPKAITKNATNSITYYYDAIGTKLKQTMVLNGGSEVSRYYLDGFEYDKDKVLSIIHMDEGVINHSSGNFTYEYFIKDHLGSIRAAFEPGENNTVLLTQSTDYYTFGLSFSEQYNNTTDNGYLYNGKELQDESLGGVNLDWYDYGARFFDPTIGRFHTIDPLSYISSSQTPYAYAENNPVNLIDYNGLYGDHGGEFNEIQYSIDRGWDNIFRSPEITYYIEADKKSVYSENMRPFNKWLALHTVEYDESGFFDSEGGQRAIMLGKAILGVASFFPWEAAFAGVGAAKVLSAEARIAREAETGGAAVSTAGAANAGTEGGLNLFKWGASQTGKSSGWKAGDYMLHLPNKGTPKLNWDANYEALISEMSLGKPIFDSYRLSNGNLIPTDGFLNAERFTLQTSDWIYNPSMGAWMSPF